MHLRLAFSWLPALVLAAVSVVYAESPPGELRVEIESIPDDLLLTDGETSIEVEGRTSVFGGLKYIDLFVAIDTSESLENTDPKNYRTAGATELIRGLPERSDIRLGLVRFASRAEIVTPLTDDRESIVTALESLKTIGGTNIADGIRSAIEGLDAGSRPDSSRIILLFTDGKSDRKKALAAAEEAAARDIVVHTMLLGEREKGLGLMQEIAETTGGSFLQVADPEQLPQAFRDLRTTGVDFVELSVNDGPPIRADLAAGFYNLDLPLQPGLNRVTATASSLLGARASETVTVAVSGPLRVSIAKPADGRLFQNRESETIVEIEAGIFDTVTPDLEQAYPTLGIETVTLSVNAGPPIPARFAAGSFVGSVPLGIRENRIVATATSVDGRVAKAAIDVTVRSPGCGELSVSAEREGVPAVSVTDRGLELIFDASNSMWGRMNGRPKVTIAKETVLRVMDAFPDDLFVALRVYGHRSQREEKNCRDSELLVPLGQNNREAIRDAIERFQPRGQTPLAYSLEQVSADFEDFEGDRVVALITDGIESCDGDPVAVAEGLQVDERQRPIHVIGFGLEQGPDEALASLKAIATSSGGKFLTAGSGPELQEALGETVGTPFTVWKEITPVGKGTLGADDVLKLSGGDYVLRLESDPPREFPFSLEPEQGLGIALVRTGDEVTVTQTRAPVPYTPCE